MPEMPVTAMPIPIFVLSFNRGAQLRSVINSYRLQRVPVDVIVHDNGSNNAVTLDVLRALEAEGVQVKSQPSGDRYCDRGCHRRLGRGHAGRWCPIHTPDRRGFHNTMAAVTRLRPEAR